jgi:hypothetical protein
MPYGMFMAVGRFVNELDEMLRPRAKRKRKTDIAFP